MNIKKLIEHWLVDSENIKILKVYRRNFQQKMSHDEDKTKIEKSLWSSWTDDVILWLKSNKFNI